MGFKISQFLMRTGVLASTEVTKSLHTSVCKLITYPLCAALQFGKQRHRPSPAKRGSVVKGFEGDLKKDKLFPRQCIAPDHYICSTKGRLFTSRGETKDTDMYTGGALFVDMSSEQVENVFQQDLNTDETLKAKQDFKLKCKDAGVIPWSTFLTMAQPSPPSPTLPISPIFPRFSICWSWHTSPEWSCRKGHPDHHVHCKNHDAPLSHTLDRSL